MDKQNVIINRAADCTVKQFMQCCFEEKLKVLIVDGIATDEELKAAFEYIYSEYVDFAGLYQTREFELSAYINSLGSRINTIRRFIELQRLFLKEFNMPFIPAFGIVKRYGHHLYWVHDRPDVEAFRRKLSEIEMREKRYQSEYDKKISELVEFQKKRVNKEFTLLETRREFIMMLNRLQQARFVIDKNETTVEELAMMIKDQREQVEAEKAAQQFKKRY